ncbi:hypothetical protein J2W59_002452 [Pseudomonas fluorescens]|nr:hypothetical protein [Pseudomonas fluorescens]
MSVPIRAAHAVAQISMYTGRRPYSPGPIAAHWKNCPGFEWLPFWATACAGVPPMLGP